MIVARSCGVETDIDQAMHEEYCKAYSPVATGARMRQVQGSILLLQLAHGRERFGQRKIGTEPRQGHFVNRCIRFRRRILSTKLPGLKLSVSEPNKSFLREREMAHPKRFELLTPRFVVWCSIQLSYGCVPFRSFPVAWRSSKTSSFRMQAILLRNCHFPVSIILSI